LLSQLCRLSASSGADTICCLRHRLGLGDAAAFDGGVCDMASGSGIRRQQDFGATNCLILQGNEYGRRRCFLYTTVTGWRDSDSLESGLFAVRNPLEARHSFFFNPSRPNLGFNPTYNVTCTTALSRGKYSRSVALTTRLAARLRLVEL